MADDSNETTPDEPRAEERQPEQPHRGHGTTTLLVFLVIGLAVALLWLWSTMNSRKFFLESEKGYLVVRKGMFLPAGREDYGPEDPELRTVYAPVKLPAGQTVALREFADRAELDRELFNLLFKWAQDRVYSENPDEFALGAGYMERLAKLKASSDEIKKVGALRGDLSYREGKRILDDATAQLRNAVKKFAEAEQQGAAKYTDGGRFVRTINDVIRVIEGKAAAYAPDEIDFVRKQSVAEYKLMNEARPPDGLTLTPGVPGQPVAPGQMPGIQPGAAAPVPAPAATPPQAPPANQPAATPPKPAPVPVKK